MGSDDLFHRRKGKYGRKIARREEKKKILIVCEGQSEALYFKSFPLKSLDINCVGVGRSTVSLVNYAKKLKKDVDQNKDYYDQVWCVFDKDNFTADQFNAAIRFRLNPLSWLQFLILYTKNKRAPFGALLFFGEGGI